MANPPRFLPIPGYPGYRVGEDGSIWSCRKRGGYGKGPRFGDWKQLSLTPDADGYWKVLLRRNDCSPVRCNVHRLVLTAFTKPACEGMVCRHLDGNPKNNALSNLAWGTPAQNSQDRDQHGTTARGERNGEAVLTEPQVVLIRRLAADGWTNRMLAEKFGVTYQCIRLIIRRKTWKHV